MEILRPQLACDVDLDKVQWPMLALAKIDGVRGINLNGTLTGRSLKEFKNKFVTQRFSGEHLLGLDGELVFGNWTDALLCSNTTGFVNRKTPRPGKPTEGDIHWYIFDYLAPHVLDKPYAERMMAAQDLVIALNDDGLHHIKLVPVTQVESLEDFLNLEEFWLDQGFEGAILRDPNGCHKSGRATMKLGSYLRLKRFIDFEGEVVEVTEAMENTNTAKINELGRSERSTHQENMVPKGMFGMIKMRSLSDVLDPQSKRILIVKDQVIDVGPGKADHNFRKAAFEDQSLIVGHVWKAKMFPKGQKDLPRFPTLVCPRAAEDMSDD